MNATRQIMRRQIPGMLGELAAIKLSGNPYHEVIAEYVKWLRSSSCTPHDFNTVRAFIHLCRGSQDENIRETPPH